MQPTVPVCLLPPPCKFGPGPSIEKCQHGNYWPHKNGLPYNPACFSCRPFGQNSTDPKKFIMPDFGKSLSFSDKLHANAGEPYACKNCGSTFKLLTDANEFICAECHTPLKRKKARNAPRD